MPGPMSAPESSLPELLRRWHAGDREALAELVQREGPWIAERVRLRLGPLLRARAETQDYVQDAMLEILEYAPRFVTGEPGRFRALLARIIENLLRDQHDWFAAKRRALSHEQPLPSDSILDLDRPRDSVTRPSEHAQRAEEQAWVRLALELLEAEDRKVLLLREWDGLSFADIGRQLGLSEDAARMRFNRALPRLAQQVESLRGRGDA
jgi:RNA polymerase sigma-70 factor (ECF subfamily)